MRLFPRRVDVALLGRLDALVDGRLAEHRMVRGRYRVVGGRVEIAELVVDGRPLAGALSLAGAGPSCAG